MLLLLVITGCSQKEKEETKENTKAESYSAINLEMSVEGEIFSFFNEPKETSLNLSEIFDGQGDIKYLEEEHKDSYYKQLSIGQECLEKIKPYASLTKNEVASDKRYLHIGKMGLFSDENESVYFVFVVDGRYYNLKGYIDKIEKNKENDTLGDVIDMANEADVLYAGFTSNIIDAIDLKKEGAIWRDNYTNAFALQLASVEFYEKLLAGEIDNYGYVMLMLQDDGVSDAIFGAYYAK